jgi:hypothetical protein
LCDGRRPVQEKVEELAIREWGLELDVWWLRKGRIEDV